MPCRTRYQTQWLAFAEVLRSGYRPTTFDEAYTVVDNHVSGLYREEAKAVWDVISQRPIKSIVEIGRCLGGSLYLFACACPQLERVLSVDIEWYDTSDEAFPEFFAQHGIECQLVEGDSGEMVAHKEWDFVFIDGDHTGPGVKKDLEIWKDHTPLLGFHDFADHGRRNKHIKYYPDVVAEIQIAATNNNWQQVGKRGRSEIIFETESC
jgi:dienelactone hydrolase